MRTNGMKALTICATVNAAAMAFCSEIENYVNIREIRELYRQLEKTGIGEINVATEHIVTFAQSDGMNLAGGLKEALEWTRKYVNVYPPKDAESYGSEVRLSSIEAKRKQIFAYLAFKGDARDIEAVRRFDGDILGALLERRVAGENVFDYDAAKLKPLRFLWRQQTFFPSVANTGPQAVYVREILYRYWEETGRDSSKIPQELLTMAVSFGEDGNPVCSVDLGKYGLSMPVIDPKPDWTKFTLYHELPSFYITPSKFTVKFPDLAEAVEITNDMDRHAPGWEGLYAKKPTPTPPQDETADRTAVSPSATPLEGERPREPETSGGIPAVESGGGFQPPEQTPPAAGCRRHFWLCAGVAVLTLGIGGLYAWRKKASSQKD